MDERIFLIFVVGCAVFAISISAAFLALIASDRPEDPM